MPLALWFCGTGPGRRARTGESVLLREPGDLPCAVREPPVGRTGKEGIVTTKTEMTKTETTTIASPTLMAPIAAALIGLAMVALAGHVQVAALHDAAHDVRHATGFPCH